MLRSRKFIYCMIVLFMLFAVVVSGGCGGGSSGGAYIPSSEDNNEGGGGWDVPGGDTGGDNGGDTGGGGGGGNSPMTPAVITGTWRIESGYAIASDDKGRTGYQSTYKPGRVNELGIDITKNNAGTFGGKYRDKYSLTLSGKNVIGSGITGNGSVMIDFNFINNPESEHVLVFNGGMGYRPISNTAYEMTDEDIEDNGTNLGDIVLFKSTLTLLDSSTLHWTYWTTFNEDFTGSSIVEGWQELTLKRK